MTAITVNVTEDTHNDHNMTRGQFDYAIGKLASGEAEIKVLPRHENGEPVLNEEGHAVLFIAQVELPAELETVECALRGPAVGDAPISDEETFEGVRVFGEEPRKNTSRLTNLPPTRSGTLTMIGGNGILYTIYGGPLAPQEPGDPDLKDEQREEAEAFWAVHALSAECFTVA